MGVRHAQPLGRVGVHARVSVFPGEEAEQFPDLGAEVVGVLFAVPQRRSDATGEADG